MITSRPRDDATVPPIVLYIAEECPSTTTNARREQQNNKNKNIKTSGVMCGAVRETYTIRIYNYTCGRGRDNAVLATKVFFISAYTLYKYFT